MHQRRVDGTGVTGPGPYLVRGVDDLRELAGGGCTLGDAAVLWRLLREAGRLRTEGEHAVVEVRTAEEMEAWIVRARVAARRERTALAAAALDARAEDHHDGRADPARPPQTRWGSVQ